VPYLLGYCNLIQLYKGCEALNRNSQPCTHTSTSLLNYGCSDRSVPLFTHETVRPYLIYYAAHCLWGRIMDCTASTCLSVCPATVHNLGTNSFKRPIGRSAIEGPKWRRTVKWRPQEWKMQNQKMADIEIIHSRKVWDVAALV